MFYGRLGVQVYIRVLVPYNTEKQMIEEKKALALDSFGFGSFLDWVVIQLKVEFDLVSFR